MILRAYLVTAALATAWCVSQWGAELERRERAAVAAVADSVRADRARGD